MYMCKLISHKRENDINDDVAAFYFITNIKSLEAGMSRMHELFFPE